jgi:hypothetical protein
MQRYTMINSTSQQNLPCLTLTESENNALVPRTCLCYAGSMFLNVFYLYPVSSSAGTKAC